VCVCVCVCVCMCVCVCVCVRVFVLGVLGWGVSFIQPWRVIFGGNGRT